MFAAGLSVSLLTVALIAGASAVVLRRFWAGTPWLAPAYGLLGLGLTAHAVWILCWWSRTVCTYFALAVVIASVLVLVDARFWRHWRAWSPLTVLTTSILAMAVGHAFWWGWLREPFLTAALRYGALPGDNLLQYKFAHHLWNNISTVHFYGDWNGSDRPPLQSGILLLTRPFEGMLGVSTGARFGDAHAMAWGIAASIVAQIVWVPGMYALLRALRFRKGVVALTVAFVSVIPLVVWNTTFTWPKMMSAGLGLAALAILVTLILERPPQIVVPIVAAALLTVLAFLSHGGAAFVAPVPVLLALLALRGRGLRTAAVAGALSVGAVVVAYLPWSLYSKYADPNHARLLKWHFAGVIAPDDRAFLPTLIDAYRHASRSYLIDARKANLHRVFDHDLTGRFHPGSNWPDSWRSQDFFSPPFAIGLGTVLLLALVGFWLVCLARRRGRAAELDLSIALIAACFCCMVGWALVLFLPDGATVHVGTYIWLLVFAGVAFAWSATWSLRLGGAIVAVQAGYIAVVYHRPNAHFAELAVPRLQPAYVVLLAVGVLGVVGTVVQQIVTDRRQIRVDPEAVPLVQEVEPATS